MDRALITGLDGFAARHLAELLEATGCRVVGTVLLPADASPPRLVQVDVRQRDRVRDLVRETKPDAVFHLAGLSFVPASWDDPALYFAVNAGGTANVLDAMQQAEPGTPLVCASSGEVYGFSLGECEPAVESTPCAPTSPYAVSKLAADLLAQAHARQYGTRVVRLRLFNHTGPGQRPDFFLPSMARQIALAEAGASNGELLVGNLDVWRSFADVRDIARAYLLAAERGEPGQCYNVGGQPSHLLSELVERLVAKARVPMRIVQSTELTRSAEVSRVGCDCSRFRAATGWSQQIPIEQTLADLLDYWRARVADCGPESGRAGA
jgi:GDP-4-dehydro-6-deoxy-D-mannose reductase